MKIVPTIHAPDHARGGPDPLPFLEDEVVDIVTPLFAAAGRWMLIGHNELTVPPDTETIGDPDVWQTNDNPASPVALERVLAADDPGYLGGQIKLLVSGLYHVTIWAMWEDGSAGAFDRLVLGKHFFNSDTFTPQIYGQGASTSLDSYQALGFHVLNVPGTDPTIRASFLQSDTVDRDVAWRMLVSKTDIAAASFDGLYADD